MMNRKLLLTFVCTTFALACGGTDPTLVGTPDEEVVIEDTTVTTTEEPTEETVTTPTEEFEDVLVPDVDSGTPEVDAGTPEVDAGTVDAGPTKPGNGPKCSKMPHQAKTKHCR